MLTCKELTVYTHDKSQCLLRGVDASFSGKGMHALIGPSGCGKTTLVRALLGIQPREGTVFFDGKTVHCPEQLAGKIGFAPQFSIAPAKLTVNECLHFALELACSDPVMREELLQAILVWTGLSEHGGKRVDSLSGGQLRRLGLGLELTQDPPFLICDEVTSGLDPLSEDQILDLMRSLVDEHDKTILCIIHNLAKLERFDSVTVVYGGDVVFQGTPQVLLEHFGIPDALHLYDVLNSKPVGHWRSLRSVSKEGAGEAVGTDFDRIEGVVDETVAQPAVPRLGSQLKTLLHRRYLLFFRDRGYLLLTLAITLGFPCLVVIFALGGLPQIESLTLDRQLGWLEEIQENISYRVRAMETASLVTGLIMFQVILLTLMGSNNGAREIAGERALYEKERLAGLNWLAYAVSKVLFVVSLAVPQGLWMMLFVKLVCGFPGPWLGQGVTLALACASMSVICLGFSAWLSSAEKASLLSIYLVGFQLPLSGVVLALPESLVWLCRPFITSYWGWAGYLGTMVETRLFDAFRLNDASWLPSSLLAQTILLLQALFGVVIVFLGCYRRSWK